jgi:CRP-like cAMP-binding protein
LVFSFQPLTEKEWQCFAAAWQPYEAKRKQILTAAGETERYLYVVTQGIQRVHYLDDQNREAIIVFTYAPSFGGVLDSLMLQKPSKYYYETLTPSSFLRISYSSLQSLMQEFPAIQNLVQQGQTLALSGTMQRLVELQCFSAEERFRELLRRSPHVLQLIPHKYLANYIGIDATNFSKLLNKIRL